MSEKKLRVGFDLDGIILYNPARIIRPLTAFVKDIFFKEKHLRFYHPKSAVGRLIWWLLHKSSLYISPGFWEIERLVQEGKLEAFIVTARYDFLKKDFERWIKKLNKNKVLSGWYFNEKNEEPHTFKAKMAEKLKLDIFVEDNLDIVNFLNAKLSKKEVSIFWIYNILDRRKKYEYKFSELKDVVRELYHLIYKKRQRLLVVSDYFYPHWTGFAKAIYSIVETLKKQYVITVLTIQHDKKLKRLELRDDFSVIRRPYLFSLSRSKYSFGIILNFLKEAQYSDKILINSPSANIFLYPLILKLLGKKLVIYHHAHLLLPKSPLNKFIQKLFEFFTSVSYRLADKIGTYSMDYAHNTPLLQPYLNKVEAVLIPILKNVNQPGSSKLRKKLNKLKNKGYILVGFAGRFVFEKGFDLLLEAIPKLTAKNPKIRFIFAGETQVFYENFFQENQEKWNESKSFIINLGFLQEEELGDFYRSLDFIVVPSRIDSFNLVQAEAALNGTPIIASNIPGLRFLVQKTGFGLLFEKENSQDLVNKLNLAINKRNELIKNYPKVKELLNRNALSKKLKDFIYY